MVAKMASVQEIGLQALKSKEQGKREGQSEVEEQGVYEGRRQRQTRRGSARGGKGWLVKVARKQRIGGGTELHGL